MSEDARISVEEAKKLKRQYEKEIDGIIKSYYNRTGLVVDGINIIHDAGTMPFIQMEVKV